jgi:hypothetical protein
MNWACHEFAAAPHGTKWPAVTITFLPTREAVPVIVLMGFETSGVIMSFPMHAHGYPEGTYGSRGSLKGENTLTRRPLRLRNGLGANLGWYTLSHQAGHAPSRLSVGGPDRFNSVSEISLRDFTGKPMTISCPGCSLQADPYPSIVIFRIALSGLNSLTFFVTTKQLVGTSDRNSSGGCWCLITLSSLMSSWSVRGGSGFDLGFLRVLAITSLLQGRTCARL